MCIAVMPVDQATRDYLTYVVDSVKSQTTGHIYTGNLSLDAKRLGISLEQLHEIVKNKVPTTTIARDLFKKMIPESQRQVDKWNQLTGDVLLKEKLLIGI